MVRKNSSKELIATNSLVLAFLVLMIVLLLSSCCSTKVKKEYTRDTVVTEIYLDSVTFQKEPELTYDSTLPDIVIKPFKWEIDSLIPRVRDNKLKFDTLRAKYSYPENIFEFSYLPPPDTVFMESVKETITQVEELGFWDYIPIVVSTALIFFVLGYIVSKFR